MGWISWDYRTDLGWYFALWLSQERMTLAVFAILMM